jgi:hypothetical protein
LPAELVEHYLKLCPGQVNLRSRQVKTGRWLAAGTTWGYESSTIARVRRRTVLQDATAPACWMPWKGHHPLFFTPRMCRKSYVPPCTGTPAVHHQAAADRASVCRGDTGSLHGQSSARRQYLSLRLAGQR